MSDNYTYESTNTLINKENFKDSAKLNYFESSSFILGLIKVLKDGFKVSKTSDIFKLHHILFTSVYTWAGEKRTCNIYKAEKVINYLSVKYENFNNIEKEIDKLDLLLEDIDWNNNNTFVDKLIKFTTKLWKIHPFREGNTRIVFTFLYFLLQEHQISVNIYYVAHNPKYIRDSLVMASIGGNSALKYIENVFEKILIPWL